MNSETLKVKAYRLRAAEVRRIADGIVDPACRKNLVAIAENYERLAASIELRVDQPFRQKSIH